jgi:hypothetical protein
MGSTLWDSRLAARLDVAAGLVREPAALDEHIGQCRLLCVTAGSFFVECQGFAQHGPGAMPREVAEIQGHGRGTLLHAARRQATLPKLRQCQSSVFPCQIAVLIIG